MVLVSEFLISIAIDQKDFSFFDGNFCNEFYDTVNPCYLAHGLKTTLKKICHLKFF